MNKKRFVCVFLAVLMMFPLFAEERKSIDIEAIVPDDYGIVIPEAIAIDRLVFEIELESGEEELLTENELFLGELNSGLESSSFNLLYYGNLSFPYDVVLRATSTGLYSPDSSGHIPVEIEVLRASDCNPEIETTSLTDDEMHLIVPPMGLMEAESVLTVSLSWDSPRDIPLGRYVGTVDVELRSI